jgi:signal transduction histidine kinase
MVLVDERTQELQREIAKRKQAEQALRNACDDLELRVEERTAQLSQLSGRLLHLQDEERRRIARELHDSTGQSLITLVMNLAQLDKLAGTMDPAARQALSESRALAKDCSNEIRTLSYLLHPPMLDQVGLAKFLPWYANGFTERSGIRVQVNVTPDLGRLPREVEIVLFRIVQESLTNIQRHSDSPTAGIRLFRQPAEVTMEVSDQGRGIPSKTLIDLRSKDGAGAGLGVGIAGMRERLKQLGGRLDITSGEQGTTVRAVLPLPKEVETFEKGDGNCPYSDS